MGLYQDDKNALINYIKTVEESEQDILRYIRFEAPSLIMDYDRANLMFLDMESKQLANTIVSMNITKALAEKNRPREKGAKDNSFELFKSKFQQQIQTNKLNDYDEKSFNNLYSLFNKVELSPLKEMKVVDKNIFELSDALLEIYTKDDAIKFIWELYSDPNDTIQSLNNNLKLSIEKIRKLQKLIIKVLKKGLEIQTLNLLCSVYLTTGYDYLIENHLLYYLFTAKIKCFEYPLYEGAIVVDPSPLFVKKWMIDSYLNDINVLFIFSDKFQSLYFKNETADRKNMYCVHIDEMEDVKKLSNTFNEFSNHMLIFGNHINDNGLKRSQINFFCSIFKMIDISIFDYDTNLESDFISNMISMDFKVTSVDLFPLNLVDEEFKKRKTFIAFSRLGTDSKTNVIHYSIDKTGSHQSLVPKSYVGQIESSLFLNPKFKVRSLFNFSYRNHLKKTGEQRNAALRFKFTEEIYFYYRFSFDKKNKNYRVGAYAVEPVFYEDGTLNVESKIKLDSTLKNCRQKDKEHILKWLNEVYPYSQINSKEKGKLLIHDEICSIYKNKFSRKPITLKSFIYFYLEELNSRYGETQIEKLFLISNKDLGDTLLENITIVLVEQALDQFYKDDNDSTNRYQIKALLSSVIDYSVSKHHARMNRIKDAVLEESNRSDKAYYQSRDNLTIKYFSKLENEKIYKIIKKNLNKDTRYLGAFIKLVTGLESNIVCALQWKDFRKLDDYNNDDSKYQLLIRKQLVNDGSSFAKFKKKESYRKIPCSNELVEVLLRERELQLHKYGFENIELLNSFAIVEGEDCFIDGITKTLSPIQLSKFCNSMVKKLRKDYSLITNIPDSKKGTIETDFLSYGGDIFKSNYRHYALYKAGFNSGEIDYLQGKQTDLPFSRNYCDYGNDASQVILNIKQNRFMGIFDNRELPLAIQTNLSNKKRQYVSQSHGNGNSDLIIKIEVEEDITLEINNDYGFDMQVIQTKGNK